MVATESPEAQITAPSADGIFYSDQLITFEGMVSDGEDVATDLVASWESSLDGELEVEAQLAEMSAARDKGKAGGMSVHGTTARHFGGHAYC